MSRYYIPSVFPASQLVLKTNQILKSVNCICLTIGIHTVIAKISYNFIHHAILYWLCNSIRPCIHVPTYVVT